MRLFDENKFSAYGPFRYDLRELVAWERSRQARRHAGEGKRLAYPKLSLAGAERLAQANEKTGTLAVIGQLRIVSCADGLRLALVPGDRLP